MKVVIGVPCHEAEPAVGATVLSLARAAAPLARRGDAVGIVVCVNGVDPARSPARASLAAVTPEHMGGVPVLVVDLAVASKTAAWNRLRAEPADVTVFADADIEASPDAVARLVDALADRRYVAATAGQRHLQPPSVAGRVAAIPHRLEWGGLLGTLYAARTAELPEQMPDVLLDDAWLFGTLGADRIVRVPEAAATVRLAATWRDLWRQRVRAEGGKAQLRRLGVPLAEPPADLSVAGVLRAYPRHEWPLVALLWAVKLLARLRARVGPRHWTLATSTKTPTENDEQKS